MHRECNVMQRKFESNPKVRICNFYGVLCLLIFTFLLDNVPLQFYVEGLAEISGVFFFFFFFSLPSS